MVFKRVADKWCEAGGEAAAGQVAEEKSVLEALQDLGSHFGSGGNLAAAADAADAAMAEVAPPEDGPEPQRQRIGKVAPFTTP